MLTLSPDSEAIRPTPGVKLCFTVGGIGVPHQDNLIVNDVHMGGRGNRSGSARNVEGIAI